MSDQDAQPTELLLSAAKMLGREISATLGPFRLAPAQFAVLDIVGIEGEMRPSIIARKLDIESSTATNTINRCVRDGFLDRDVDPHNSKSVNVRLTEKGRAVLDDARAAVARVEDSSLSGFGQDEITALVRGLTTIIANLK